MAFGKGSAMSSKQLARTVIDGRKVTFSFAGLNWHIEGYVCGMDDFHLFVITPEGDKHLLHKGSISVMTIAEHSTYDDEPNRQDLEQVVGPFRAAVVKEHLAPPTTQTKERLAVS